MSARILIIEDHADIVQLIRLNLREHQIEQADNGARGLELALQGNFDLILLDLMLPLLNGLEICQRLRQARIFTPILMLSARSSEAERVSGLDAGADDYLPKPFTLAELKARVNAQLRRSGQYQIATVQAAQPECIDCGKLQIKPQSREVEIAGESLNLTAREFDLLWHFARAPGQVFTRCELLQAVWGYAHAGYEHTVNTHINRLRAKLEADPAQPQYVLTVWGVGYKFTEQAPAG